MQLAEQRPTQVLLGGPRSALLCPDDSVTGKVAMTNVKPRLQPREGAAEYTGLSVRQLLRKEQAGVLRRCKPSGPTGPTYYLTEDLDALIERSIVPAGVPAGARPPGRKPKAS